MKVENKNNSFPRPLGGPGASPPKGNQAILLIHLRPKGSPKTGRKMTGRASGRK